MQDPPPLPGGGSLSKARVIPSDKCGILPLALLSLLGRSERSAVAIFWASTRRCSRGALKSTTISRLNTRLVTPPVNTSVTPSRAPPHDSGPRWVATPSSYKTLTCYSSTVSTGVPLPVGAPLGPVGPPRLSDRAPDIVKNCTPHEALSPASQSHPLSDTGGCLLPKVGGLEVARASWRGPVRCTVLAARAASAGIALQFTR